MGSPIGKVEIEDEEGFQKQLVQLDTLCQICKLLDCRYIRMFSFYIPKGKNPDDYRETVLNKLKQFAAIAEKYDVVLIHENEKDIYGDIARRCKDVLDNVGSEHFKAAFDYANFVQCGEDTATCWELLKDNVAYIHIKDAVYGKGENVLCGTGDGKNSSVVGTGHRIRRLSRLLDIGTSFGIVRHSAKLGSSGCYRGYQRKQSKRWVQRGYTMQYNALKEILAKFCN